MKLFVNFIIAGGIWVVIISVICFLGSWFTDVKKWFDDVNGLLKSTESKTLDEKINALADCLGVDFRYDAEYKSPTVIYGTDSYAMKYAWKAVKRMPEVPKKKIISRRQK